MGSTDEHELRALFAEIDAPPGLDGWRDRIADVHVDLYEREPEPLDLDADETDETADQTDDQTAAETDDETEPTGDAEVIVLPTGPEPGPGRQRRRPVAVAAAAAVVVGLAGIVVASTLLSDSPPADPTMIIDGPDRTITSLPPPTAATVKPPGTPTTRPPESGQGQPHPGSGGGGTSAGQTTGRAPRGYDADAAVEPTWPPMSGDPTAANTGVPLGATLGDHYGNLLITSPGQVVSDLRVTGTVIVDAPNVTLKRVLVVAPNGAPAVRQNATGLTVVNSELTGGSSLIQAASGLKVNRSRLQYGVTITSGAVVVDSYFDTADVLVTSGSSSISLRHNAMDRVTMSDLDGPISGVTVENNLLNRVDAPTQAGSASIHVLGNRFRGNSPSTGWNPSAPDYRWADNTFVDSGAPASP
ncbi:hypothetical protein [Actinophytocola sp.]|uniref:hypothetical protein n=1 Tax=Actinophytocola sp. TaxID=1872138 RepID=UPI00389A3449